MGHSQFDDAIRERATWNAGKTVGTKRPLTQKQIWAIRRSLDGRFLRAKDRIAPTIVGWKGDSRLTASGPVLADIAQAGGAQNGYVPGP